MDGTGFIINQLYNIIFVISLRKLDLPAWTFDLVHLMIWETLLNGVRDAKLLIEGTPIAVLRANIALLSINRTIQIKHILLCNQKHAYINIQHSFSFDNMWITSRLCIWDPQEHTTTIQTNRTSERAIYYVIHTCMNMCNRACLHSR